MLHFRESLQSGLQYYFLRKTPAIIYSNLSYIVTLFSFPFSLLVSAECRLTPWNIPLIVMSALAMVATLVGTIVTIHDGMTVCHIHLREQDQTITKCCSDIRKDIRTGELS